MLDANVTIKLRRNSDFKMIKELVQVQELEVVLTLNDLSSWKITMPGIYADSLPVALQDLGDVGIEVWRDVGFGPQLLIDGPAVVYHRTIKAGVDQLVLQGTDDNQYLADTICMPNCGGLVWNASLGHYYFQNTTSGYDVRSGTAETVIKGLVEDNIGANALGERKVPNLLVADSAGRGLQVVSSTKCENLLTQLQGLANSGGLNFRLMRQQNQLVFDVFEGSGQPTLRPITFSQENGSLREYDLIITHPQANYCLVGGPGQDENKVYEEVRDTDSMALFGRVEDSIDASNVQAQGTTTDAQDQADIETALQLAGYADLASKAWSIQCTMALTETPKIQYNKNFYLGDTATVALNQGMPDTNVTDAIREVYYLYTSNPTTNYSSLGTMMKRMKMMSRILKQVRQQKSAIRMLTAGREVPEGG